MAAGDLLQLLIAQLDAAIKDNDNAMAGLVESYGKITADIEQLQQDDADDSERNHVQQRLTEQLAEAAVGFQEHDAFNQRLEHVMTAMGDIKALIDADQRDAECWQQLADRISASYTTTMEQEVHCRLTGTAPPQSSNDIEMF